MVAPLLRAIPTTRKAPYPPSPVIRGVHWAPRGSIVRQAKDSDNWPLTWADDDALYTAYGDGYGFDPAVPDKLSLGFAKVDRFARELHRDQHPLGDRRAEG